MGCLLLLLLVTSFLPFITRACDYRPPSEDDVTIAFTEYPSKAFAGAKHPSEADKRYPSKTRIKGGDEEWDWIRIEIAYDRTIWLLNEKDRKKLKDLVKTARDYFESTIKVKRLNSLQLSPSCAGRKKPKRFAGRLVCNVDCIKQCGQVIAPSNADYYHECVCSDGPCTTNSTFWGGRLRNADFMLFVSANTKECKKQTLAFASHCAIDWFTNRPVAGFVNICPHSFTNMKPFEMAQWEATVKHELIHTFVFSNTLYDFYRVPLKGTKSTTRSSDVLQLIPRSDWESAEGEVPHNVHMIVTPKVKREAQNYFNCPSLEGAEIESQGDGGTRFSHWEKRILENEAMTGVSTQVYAISRITLALFEDSGWYKANYDFGKAENMTFGKGLGCSFAKQSCLTWIKAHLDDPYPFCRVYGHVRCTKNRKAKVRCNLETKRRKEVESHFDYNVKDLYTDGKGKAVRGYGAIDVADHCPYYRTYSEFPSNDTDTRCTLPLNMNYLNYTLEVFSPTARCIELTSDGINVKNPHHGSITWYHATGCYETLCDKNLLFIKTQKSKFYPCYGQGQLIHVKKRLHGIGTVSFRIVCPNCAEVCGEHHCAPERRVASKIGDDDRISGVNSVAVFSALIIKLLCSNVT